MKKVISIILTCLLLLSLVSVAFGSFAAEKPEELVNTLYKLQNDKELTIGYFGGSVTYGQGATDVDATSWRALTTKWFMENFEGTTVTEIAAAIGGTSSTAAIYRADNDLIGKAEAQNKKLDLVFIEFAINDIYDNTVWGDGVSKIHNSYSNIETVMGKIYAHNPKADIVFVVTGDNEQLQKEINSETPVFGAEFTRIANKHNLPIIYAGRELALKIYSENSNSFPSVDDTAWTKYFTDLVHPNDRGYESYAETVTAALNISLKSGYTAEAADYTDFTFSFDDTYTALTGKGDLYPETSVVFDVADLNGTVSGFEKKNADSTSTTATHYESRTAGDTISFKFKGSSVGFWAHTGSDKPAVEYTIDGGAAKTINIDGGTNVNTIFMLAAKLDPSVEHTVEIKNTTNTYFALKNFVFTGTPYGIDDNTQKQMLHIVNNSTSSNYTIRISAKDPLEYGTYRFKFKVNSINGAGPITQYRWGTASGVYKPNENNNYGYYWGSKFDGVTVNQQEFTLNESNFAKGLNSTFFFDLTIDKRADSDAANIDFYMADIGLYKVVDGEEQENLLNIDNYSTDESLIGSTDGYSNGNNCCEFNANITTFQFIKYNRSLFEYPENPMLHITGSSANYNRLGVKLSEVPKATTTYMLKFRINDVSNSFTSTGNYNEFGFLGRKSDHRVATGGWMQDKFTLPSDENTMFKQAITFSENFAANSAEAYLVFYTPKSKNIDFYLKDLVLYDINDPEKKNILMNSVEQGSTNWIWSSDGGTNSITQNATFKYMETTDAIFPEMPEKMLHVYYDGWGTYGFYVPFEAQPQAGKQYIITGDVSYAENSNTFNNFRLMRSVINNLSTGNYTVVRSTSYEDISSTGGYQWLNYSEQDGKFRFTFQFAESDLVNSSNANENKFYLAFGMPGCRAGIDTNGKPLNAYIANLKCYAVDDVEQKNLFSEDFDTDLSHVQAKDGKTLTSAATSQGGTKDSKTEILTVDKSKFQASTKPTVLHKYGTGYTEGGINLRVFEPAEADREYILEFNQSGYNDNSKHTVKTYISTQKAYRENAKTHLQTMWYNEAVVDKNKITHSFKFEANVLQDVDWRAKAWYINFAAGDIGTYYLGNIKLYKVVDGERVEVPIATSSTATVSNNCFTTHYENGELSSYLKYEVTGGADLKADNKVDILDLVLAKKYIGTSYAPAADMDANVRIDADDLKLIIKEILGKK